MRKMLVNSPLRSLALWIGKVKVGFEVGYPSFIYSNSHHYTSLIRRREGLRYRKNEVYIDVNESVNLLMGTNGERSTYVTSFFRHVLMFCCPFLFKVMYFETSAVAK
jgi:hypothetical protein